MNKKSIPKKASQVPAKPKIMTLTGLKALEAQEDMIRPQIRQKELISKAPPKRNALSMPHGQKTVKIGLVLSKDKWRCLICTFLNDATLSICQTCESAKGETKPNKKINVNLRKRI